MTPIILGLASLFILNVTPTFAAETDNYTLPVDYLEQYPDVTDMLNQHVNESIATSIKGWKKGKQDLPGVVRRIAWNIDGTMLYGKNEWWTRRNADARVYFPEQSIYEGINVTEGIALVIYGIVPTAIVNGVPIGIDKISHFFDGGVIYRNQFRSHQNMIRLLSFGEKTESGLFGQWSTGVFSNGDLIANYEGFIFLRSLIEDDAIPGKKAIVGFDENDRAFMQRQFDLRDHVNEFWNEAMNPSEFREVLKDKVLAKIGQRCSLFEKNPELFVPKNAKELSERYKGLGLREHPEQRLDQICKK